MDLNDKQIESLAREYAEEMCAHMEDDFIKDEAIRDNKLAFQMAVEHLSRRFYLVEKKDIEAKYQEAKECYFDTNAHKTDIVMYGGRISLLEYLFPEIAKEVEE